MQGLNLILFQVVTDKTSFSSRFLLLNWQNLRLNQDIDDLENVHEYNNDTYNLFYENAIKKTVEKSNDKNIILASCINPTDIERINIPKEIQSIHMIAITCSNDELYKRLKNRDSERNCSSDEFINNQIDYQNWILKHINLYQLHIDNTNNDVSDVVESIIEYIDKIDLCD